jgi:hypothetical protein
MALPELIDEVAQKLVRAVQVASPCHGVMHQRWTRILDQQ